MRIYGGFRPYMPDHLPVIGADPRLRGLWHATGHEGAGIGLALATGGPARGRSARLAPPSTRPVLVARPTLARPAAEAGLRPARPTSAGGRDRRPTDPLTISVDGDAATGTRRADHRRRPAGRRPLAWRRTPAVGAARRVLRHRRLLRLPRRGQRRARRAGLPAPRAATATSCEPAPDGVRTVTRVTEVRRHRRRARPGSPPRVPPRAPGRRGHPARRRRRARRPVLAAPARRPAGRPPSAGCTTAGTRSARCATRSRPTRCRCVTERAGLGDRADGCRRPTVHALVGPSRRPHRRELAPSGRTRWCSPPAPTTAPCRSPAGTCPGSTPPARRRRWPRASASPSGARVVVAGAGPFLLPGRRLAAADRRRRCSACFEASRSGALARGWLPRPWQLLASGGQGRRAGRLRRPASSATASRTGPATPSSPRTAPSGSRR